jgi:acetolactate synthase-1/2/3 large subunit|tara:strand:+ start:4353 stop:6032 length:1680 start_codon:yes stop_codon:yes gene_type:complete
MNICDYIIETLYLNGIDTYFVITGGAIVPFINAIAKNPKVKYYCFQHEQSAAMAAEGYYRSCGKIAGVCVTSGPGVQNILNGVCGCWYDSVPAFFISGQVNTAEDLSNFVSKPRQTGFQEMPVADMFRDVTKESLHVPDVSKIKDILSELLISVKTPRFGPVLMDLPVNLQMSSVEGLHPFTVTSFKYNQKHTYDISRYIKDSKRPLVIFGHGVKLAGATKEALDFVEKNGIPFLVSWGAFDICRTDHPLRLGSPGVYGDRYANYAIQNADLLISIGSRLDSRQIGGNAALFSKHSKKIMVDIDDHEITKMGEKGINIDFRINENAKDFLQNVITGQVPNVEQWLINLKLWKSKYGVEKDREGDSAVYDYLRDLFDKIEDDCIVIPDQGGNLVWTMQSAKLKEGQKLFTNFGNSSMGFALPAAIGAAIGSRKKVYCIDGDGGFQMNVQELLTVKKYDLPIEIIILNNSGYGIIKQFQDSYFDSKYTATSKSDVFGDEVDFVKIAEAYGVKTLQDIPIPETQKIYPKLEFGNSLENMTPYIDFESDMFVPVPPKKKLGWA